MALGGLVKWIASASSNGPFSPLTKLIEERGRTKRAGSWEGHTVDVLTHLGDGMVYEENTPEGSLKIWKPPAQTPHISVTVDHQEPEPRPHESPEIQGHQPRALDQ